MGQQIHRERRPEVKEEVSDETIRNAGGVAVKEARETSVDADAMLDEIDALLDDTVSDQRFEEILNAIDETLETNAVEFVQNYQQKGGE